jgi:uncharacterized membrane protein YoaK (UPF0700 family)
VLLLLLPLLVLVVFSFQCHCRSCISRSDWNETVGVTQKDLWLLLLLLLLLLVTFYIPASEAAATHSQPRTHT